MQCINLNKQTVKIRRIHFSYQNEIEEEKCFKSMENERVNSWRKDCNIQVTCYFKSCSSALIKTVPIFTMAQWNIIKNIFIYQGNNQK